MKLVYTKTQLPVEIGDRVMIGDQEFVVDHFALPHKPSSSGRLVLRLYGQAEEYFTSVIGAEWIEREDWQ